MIFSKDQLETIIYGLKECIQNKDDDKLVSDIHIILHKLDEELLKRPM